MIRILFADDAQKAKLGITDMAYIVTNNDGIMGYCEFSFDNGTVYLSKAVCDDISLLDGLLRQTLSYSLDNGCPNATFSDDVKDKLFNLKIIKNINVENLDILEFFTKLNGCEKF